MDKISVFTFPTAIEHIINLETRPNPMGLRKITPLETSTKQIIAYPGNKIGSVHIMVITDIILYKVVYKNNYFNFRMFQIWKQQVLVPRQYSMLTREKFLVWL